nr:VP2 [Gyrovirus galga1]
MSSGGLGDCSACENRAAGGSELPLRQEGQLGPSGAGSTGKTLNADPPLSPTSNNYSVRTINGIRASNKFVSASRNDLDRDPNWYRVNYNYSIATWLRQCARSHDEICTCGRWRSHWFQEASGLVTQETQTDQLARDLRRLRRKGEAAKRKLDYLKGKRTPYKKAKTVTWQDYDDDDLVDALASTTEDDGTGDTDCDEDAIPGGVNFDMRGEDPLIAALRGGSSTHTRAPMW